jgi:hypothetical protein
MEGRALYDLAYITLRNLRKASARVQKYIKVDGTPNASGHSKDNVVRLLLDDMYLQLKGKSSMGEADLSDNESEENDGTEENDETDAIDGTSEKPPSSWPFPGFMTFMLFGPMAPEEQRIDFFLIKDPKKEVKKSYGRVAMREDKKKQNELERQLRVGGEGPEARGKTFNERVQVAALDLQVSRFDQERQEGSFLSFKIEADLLQKQIDRAYKIAELDGDYLRYKKLEK